MKDLQYSEYLKTMRGCFLGKTIGGTLGMPYEGILEVNHVTYYDPVPTAMVPNDDLDLQVINLELVRRYGLPVCGKDLAEFWTGYMNGFPDEYGVANHNVIRGLYPPVSGHYGNAFHGGMGAAIRSELWACLAPGDPDLAVKLALEDASTDHDNDGIDACAFLTAVESAAFFEKDRDTLLEIGISRIGRNERMTCAFHDVIKWWNDFKDALKIRSLILENYPSQNWTDVTINLSFILLSWLASGGDFGKGICTAASLGYDADCTCATLGAIMGLLAPDGIDEKWTYPIGNELVLSPCISGAHEPKTIDALMNLIGETAAEVQKVYGSAIRFEEDPAAAIPVYTGAPCRTHHIECVSYRKEDTPKTGLVSLSPLVIRVVYPDEVALMDPEGTDLILKFANPADRGIDAGVFLRVPNGWRITPSEISVNVKPGEEMTFRCSVSYPEDGRYAWKNSLDIVCMIDGLRFETSAGLILPIPYLLCGEKRYASSNVLKVGAGKQKIVLNIKAGANMENMRILAQGTRTLRLTINGQTICEHDNSFYVPAFHRNPDAAIASLKEGWNEVVIDMDRDEPAGEVFFGVADRYGWKWANLAEYRMPEVQK